MNTSFLLQQTAEKLDFNALEKEANNALDVALTKIDQQLKQQQPSNLLQILLHQTFTILNQNTKESNENFSLLESALQTLHRGIVGVQQTEEMLLDEIITEEELPDLPDLGEDILATETMSDLFVSAKNDYKEPRSFVLDKPRIEVEVAVITTHPINPIQKPEQMARQVKTTITKQLAALSSSSFSSQTAQQFFRQLPFEKALAQIRVVEEETGEETRFRVLPAQQRNHVINDNNQIINPLVAATLQAIQTSGGKVPANLNKIDYNTVESRAFFSALAWNK